MFHMYNLRSIKFNLRYKNVFLTTTVCALNNYFYKNPDWEVMIPFEYLLCDDTETTAIEPPDDRMQRLLHY